jgi:hypothetical protein
VRVASRSPTLPSTATVTTAVDKSPASARLSAVATAGDLPTAPTPRPGTRPQDREGIDDPGSLIADAASIRPMGHAMLATAGRPQPDKLMPFGTDGQPWVATRPWLASHQPLRAIGRPQPAIEGIGVSGDGERPSEFPSARRPTIAST